MEFERPKSLFSPKLQIWFSSAALKTNTKRTLFIFFLLPYPLPSFACSYFPGFYLFAESALAAQPACLSWSCCGGLAGGCWGEPAPTLLVLMVAGGTQRSTETCESVSLLSPSASSPCSLGPAQRGLQCRCPGRSGREVGGQNAVRVQRGLQEGEAQS